MSGELTTTEGAPQPMEQQTLLQRLAVRGGRLRSLILPILAVFTALVIGAIIIAVSSADVLTAWKGLFHDPLNALSVTWTTIRDAYVALFQGSFGDPRRISEAVRLWRETGETKALWESLRPIGESLVLSTPYIFAGLAVALGFRGGLFNIGAEGQLFVGGLASVFVGYSIKGLPAYVHLPLALLAGIAAGGLWGAIPGFLKARTGAHEVINTIMMNYIAFRLTEFLLQGPMAGPGGLPMTVLIAPSAELPLLLPSPVRVHLGFILSLIAAGFVYWFLWKTTRGMEIRMAGTNPDAARCAGVKTSSTMVLTMVLSGALAGLAGTSHILGVDHKMVRAFSTGYGFDSIALALLGNSHPLGVVLASLLFGFMRAGAARMQSVANVPVEIIRVLQATVIIFVAAPEILRRLYRLKAVRAGEEPIKRGW